MIPASFDYEVAESVNHALELLRTKEDAKLIAGGHSLLPLMKLRLARPGTLVNIGRLDLRGVRDAGDHLAIGGLTRHHDLNTDAAGAPALSADRLRGGPRGRPPGEAPGHHRRIARPWRPGLGPPHHLPGSGRGGRRAGGRRGAHHRRVGLLQRLLRHGARRRRDHRRRSGSRRPAPPGGAISSSVSAPSTGRRSAWRRSWGGATARSRGRRSPSPTWVRRRSALRRSRPRSRALPATRSPPRPRGRMRGPTRRATPGRPPTSAGTWPECSRRGRSRRRCPDDRRSGRAPRRARPDACAYPPAMSASTPLQDGFGRVHRSLRVSVTDRCNLRCRYCMPAEGMKWLDRRELLTDDELLRVVRRVRAHGGGASCASPAASPWCVPGWRASSAASAASRASTRSP